MNMNLVIVGLVPIIVYVVVSFWKNDNSGVWAAMISGLAALFAIVWLTGDWDESAILECVLILTLGFVAIKMKNPIFFKFQPTVVGIVLAIFLAWYEIRGTPYLTLMMERTKDLSPEFAQVSMRPGFKEMLDSISFQLIFLFLAHAGLMALAALRLKNLGWMLTRLAIYPAVIALAAVNQVMWLSRMP